MIKSWYNHYKDRMNDSYRQHVERHYGAFIDRVVKLAAPHEFIMEAGCGAGFVGRVVARKLPDCKLHMVDKDWDLVGLIDQNTRESRVNNCFLTIHDILDSRPPKSRLLQPRFEPGMYGCIFSHGVLEHFTDQDINQALAVQWNLLKPGGHLIHYVPSSMYQEPSFGDERLMSAREWQMICCPDEIEHFNHGYDMTLMWRKP